MRIVIAGDFPISPPNVVGGIQAVIYFTLSHLSKYPDVEIDVVTCEKWGQLKDTKPWIQKEQGWTTHYLPSSLALPHTLTMLTVDRWKLARAIRQLKPDVIHAHGQAAAYPWAGFDTRLPTVVTVHGINALEASIDRRGGRWRGSLRAFVWERIEKACLRRAKDIIIISPFVARTIQPYTTARLHWIENPVQPDLFSLPREAVVPGRVLYVGSIQKRKGLLDLIQAIHILQARIPEAHLHVAGGFTPFYAQYGELVRSMVDKLALTAKVKFLGHLERAELLAEYRSCSAFCLPSYLEASPVVIAEAMAAGCPILSTDIESTAHLVNEGENGFRIPPGDVDTLAKQLEAVLASPALQQQLGRSSRRIARERFQPQKAAQATYHLYQECIHQQAKR